MVLSKMQLCRMNFFEEREERKTDAIPCQLRLLCASAAYFINIRIDAEDYPQRSALSLRAALSNKATFPPLLMEHHLAIGLPPRTVTLLVEFVPSRFPPAILPWRCRRVFVPRVS